MARIKQLSDIHVEMKKLEELRAHLKFEIEQSERQIENYRKKCLDSPDGISADLLLIRSGKMDAYREIELLLK